MNNVLFFFCLSFFLIIQNNYTITRFLHLYTQHLQTVKKYSHTNTSIAIGNWKVKKGAKHRSFPDPMRTVDIWKIKELRKETTVPNARDASYFYSSFLFIYLIYFFNLFFLKLISLLSFFCLLHLPLVMIGIITSRYIQPAPPTYIAT